ncbi:hypothetical protein D3C87_1906860 [compost metagenome]
MVEADDGFEAQLRGGSGDIDQRDAIAENIVNPADGRRLRKDIEAAAQKRLVETVARAEHQPVLAEMHRPFVMVGCDVADGENRHPASAFS